MERVEHQSLSRMYMSKQLGFVFVFFVFVMIACNPQIAGIGKQQPNMTIIFLPTRNSCSQALKAVGGLDAAGNKDRDRNSPAAIPSPYQWSLAKA